MIGPGRTKNGCYAQSFVIRKPHISWLLLTALLMQLVDDRPSWTTPAYPVRTPGRHRVIRMMIHVSWFRMFAASRPGFEFVDPVVDVPARAHFLSYLGLPDDWAIGMPRRTDRRGRTARRRREQRKRRHAVALEVGTSRALAWPFSRYPRLSL